MRLEASSLTHLLPARPVATAPLVAAVAPETADPVGGAAPYAPQLAPPGRTGDWLPRAGAWLKGAISKVVGLFHKAPVSPEPTGGGGGTYTVQGGDSLSKIAAKTLGSAGRWKEIYELNRDQIANPNVIQPGQVLKLPGGPSAPAPAPAPKSGSYTVKPGDTLSKIAARTLGSAGRWQEIYAANRDKLFNPNIVYPGTVLTIPGGSSTAPAPAPAPSAGGFGGKAVAAGRALKAAGYHYTVNLTTNYHPVRFKIGCCADFAVDTWAKAGIDLYGRINNPHYCPNLVNYFKGGRDGHHWIGKGDRAAVGDMVFFDWDHSGDADHTAIVTEVDGNGRPTKIIESYNFNLPVRERAVGSSLGNIIGYGRA
jgi:nucleoid-associated protein YgaU